MSHRLSLLYLICFLFLLFIIPSFFVSFSLFDKVISKDVFTSKISFFSFIYFTVKALSSIYNFSHWIFQFQSFCLIFFLWYLSFCLISHSDHKLLFLLFKHFFCVFLYLTVSLLIIIILFQAFHRYPFRGGFFYWKIIVFLWECHISLHLPDLYPSIDICATVWIVYSSNFME